MNYISLVCSALLCIGYTVSAVYREQSKASRGCDITLAVLWGLSAVCNLLSLLG